MRERDNLNNFSLLIFRNPSKREKEREQKKSSLLSGSLPLLKTGRKRRLKILSIDFWLLVFLSFY